MSVDTAQRVNDYWDSEVATPENIYTIHIDKNEGIPATEGGGGTWVTIETQTLLDNLTGRSSVSNCFTEDGMIIIKIYAQKGLGNLDLYSLERVSDLVKKAFRFDKPLLMTGTQEGNIYFEDIIPRQTITDPAPGLSDYRRKDIFINYQKTYE